MMMAHDQPGQPPAPVSEDTRRALRAALEAYLEQGGDIAVVRQPLQQLIREGREVGAYAEQLLILLKEIWYGIPAVQHLRSPEQQSRLLQRVVTVSIHAYYDVTPPAE